jgi:CheY-like chemotaxis protein
MPTRILIVEDNEKNRRLVRDVLAYHGFDVIEAEDGEQGIRLARERQPALILLDMQMPVLDGFAATAQLKGDPQTSKIKIIAVTSFAMKGDRERILALGVDDYLAKPIDTRQLPAVVKSVLG